MKGRNTGWPPERTAGYAQKKHGLVGIYRPSLANAEASWPERLIDNHKSGYAKCYNYPNSAAELKLWIEEAFAADKSKIDNSRPLMKRNKSA